MQSHQALERDVAVAKSPQIAMSLFGRLSDMLAQGEKDAGDGGVNGCEHDLLPQRC